MLVACRLDSEMQLPQWRLVLQKEVRWWSREVSTGLRVGADRGNTVAATEGGGDVLTWQPALHILYTQTRLDQAHIHISQVLNNSKFVG